MKINKSLSACQSVSDSSSSSSDDWTQIKKVTNLSLLWLNLRVAALSCCSCLFPEPPSVRLACPSVRPVEEAPDRKSPEMGRRNSEADWTTLHVQQIDGSHVESLWIQNGEFDGCDFAYNHGQNWTFVLIKQDWRSSRAARSRDATKDAVCPSTESCLSVLMLIRRSTG